MQLGMIGLGRMGANMVRRLMRGGHQCVVFDRNLQAMQDLAKEGATAATSLHDFVARLKPPRAAWLMVPAAAVDAMVNEFTPRLAKDDILIDEDKNPNTAGVVDLVPTLRPFPQLIDDIRAGRVAHVIALGGITPRNDPEDATALAMVSTLVVVAAHEGALTVRQALPALSGAFGHAHARECVVCPRSSAALAVLDEQRQRDVVEHAQIAARTRPPNPADLLAHQACVGGL